MLKKSILLSLLFGCGFLLGSLALTPLKAQRQGRHSTATAAPAPPTLVSPVPGAAPAYDPSEVDSEARGVRERMERGRGFEAFAGVGQSFWLTNPSAGVLLQAAIERGRQELSLHDTLSRTTVLLTNVPEGPIKDWLQRIAVQGALSRATGMDEVRQVASAASPSSKKVILEEYFSRDRALEPDQIYEVSRELFSFGGHTMPDEASAKAAGIVAVALALRDPFGALAWCERQKSAVRVDDGVTLLLGGASTLPRDEVVRLMVEAARLFPAPTARAIVLIGCANVDIKSVTRSLSPDQRGQFSTTLAEEIGKSDPRSAISLDSEIPPASVPATARAAIAKVLLRIDVASAGRWVDGLGASERSRMVEASLQSGPNIPGDKSAIARFCLLNSSPDSVTNHASGLALVSLVSQTGWESAKGLLQEFPKWESWGSAFRAECLRQCSPTDYGSNDAIISTASSAAEQAELSSTFLKRAAESDFDAAISWWRQSHNTADGTKQLLAVLADPKISIAPQALEAHCLNALNSGTSWESVAPAIHRIVHDLADWDTTDAIKFVERLPSGPLQGAALAKLASEWVAIDPVQASEWIADMAPGENRDDAAGILASGAVEDPERALQIVTAISDDSIRRKALETIVNAWNKVDAAALIQNIDHSSITAEEKKRSIALLKARLTPSK